MTLPSPPASTMLVVVVLLPLLLLLSTTTTTTAALQASEESNYQHQRNRYLAAGDHDPIAGFDPLTDVRDQNRIDRDQELIVRYAKEGNFDMAKAVYERGSWSKVVAVITIPNEGLPVNLKRDLKITGKTYRDERLGLADDAGSAYLKVYEGYPAGANEMQLKYWSEDCAVGANTIDPYLEGCILPEGTLYVPELDISFNYTNDFTTTRNDYEIQLFGNPAEYVFKEGDPYPPLYQWYVDYYESHTFYDDWIQAAIAGTSTNFARGNGDFSSYSQAARAEAIIKGSGYGAMWMYVFRELWHALYLCFTGDCAEDTCLNKPAVHEVDEAVAFWVGTLEGTDGAGAGVLLYALAEYTCEWFDGSCGDSTAKSNIELFKEFHDMSYNIVYDHCDAAQANTDRSIQIAAIPLVQATLHYAYQLSRYYNQGNHNNNNDDYQVLESKGATFAFFVVPLVHECDKDDADIIYRNLKTGHAAATNYEQVKKALENNYKCMGITMEDIGVYNPTIGQELTSADPEGVTYMAVDQDEIGAEGNGGRGSGATTAVAASSFFGLGGLLGLLLSLGTELLLL